METEHWVVLGLSVTGVAAALRIAETGGRVTLLEIPNEIPVRARPHVWETGLSGRDHTGADFEALAVRVLQAHGAKVERDLESLQLALSPGVKLTWKRPGKPNPDSIEGARLIYASDGRWNAGVIPETGRAFLSQGVSASAWIDATFHSGRSVAVAGAGDFAFEQLYWAAQCASEVCWIHPEERAMVSPDLIDRIHFPLTPSLRLRERVESVRRAGPMLELALSSGVTMSAHAIFFAGPPIHEHALLEDGGPLLERLGRAGIPIAGVARGAPWTHFPAHWQAGWAVR